MDHHAATGPCFDQMSWLTSGDRIKTTDHAVTSPMCNDDTPEMLQACCNLSGTSVVSVHNTTEAKKNPAPTSLQSAVPSAYSGKVLTSGLGVISVPHLFQERLWGS